MPLDFLVCSTKWVLWTHNYEMTCLDLVTPTNTCSVLNGYPHPYNIDARSRLMCSKHLKRYRIV